MRQLALVMVAVLLGGCFWMPRDDLVPYPQAVLAAAPFVDLVVEIDHAPGREPSLAAREHLVSELRNVTSKTRVSVRMEESLRDDAAKRWTIEDLLQLEAQTRSTEHAQPVAVLHVLFPAGEYQNESVAGITITGGSLVPPVTVFLDTIERVQSPVGPVTLPTEVRDQIERATLLHEAGHAMGLVNNGLPMVKPHEDADHQGHSSNEDSVMFWRVETLAGIREALLSDGSVPIYFDADDRADMRAAGGR